MTNIAHLCVIHTVPQSRTRDEDSNPEFIQTNKYICGNCNLSTPVLPNHNTSKPQTYFFIRVNVQLIYIVKLWLQRFLFPNCTFRDSIFYNRNKGNNKITELRTI